MYYADKEDLLRDIFGADVVNVQLDNKIIVDGKTYPVFDDVIILLEPPRWPSLLTGKRPTGNAAADIQATFSSEWTSFSEITEQHRSEFDRYFDIIDRSALDAARVLDLGCGIGRWSYFLKDTARELVLLDFSDAIFVARDNLRGAKNAVFFLGDVTDLPFRDDAADVAICLGVLHHLPVDALGATRALKRIAPTLLIYLYSALDSRPSYQRVLMKAVTICRRIACRIKNESVRRVLSFLGAVFVYRPVIFVGRLAALVGKAAAVPLYEFYRDASIRRISQDVYDRFFTPIEQRVRRREIERLSDTFSEIIVSDGIPEWHFVCKR